MSKIYYPSLHGLRAISIFFVIYHHLMLQNIFIRKVSQSKLHPLVITFFSDGQLGVNIFFVISGFLITSLLIIEENTFNKISIKNFYVRRIFRIFPAYYFLLLVYFVLQNINLLNITPESWITSLTYTKYLNWKLDWFTSHSWSLSIEEQFYLIWPFIFVIGHKFRLGFVISMILIPALIRGIIAIHPLHGIDNFNLLCRIDSIAVGCLISIFWSQIITINKNHMKALFFASIALLILLELGFPYQESQFGKILKFAIGRSSGTIANFCIAIIVVYTVYYSKGIIFQILNHKWIIYIGTLSYSIYLWQQFFIYKSSFWYNQFPQNLGCIAIASIASFYLIEKPFLNLKTHFSKEK